MTRDDNLTQYNVIAVSSNEKPVETILVSVVVPVYRVELYLDKFISSIVCQTYHNLEIILVNDGSPDALIQQ